MLAAHLLSKNILKTQITLPFQWLNVTVKAIRLSSSSSDSSSDSDTDSESSKKYAGAWKGSARSDDVSRTTFADSATNKKRIDYLDTLKEVQKKRQIEKQIAKAAERVTRKSGENKEKVLTVLLDNISNIQSGKSYTEISKISKSNQEINYKYKTAQNNLKYGQWDKERKIPMDGDVKEELSTIRRLQKQLQLEAYIKDKFAARERHDTNPSKIRTLQHEKWKANYDTEPSISRMMQNQKWKTKYDTEPSISRTLQNQKWKIHVKDGKEFSISISNRLANQEINSEETSGKHESKSDTQDPSIIRKRREQQTKANAGYKYIKEKYEGGKNIDDNVTSKNKREAEPSIIRSLRDRQKGPWDIDRLEARREIQKINRLINNRQEAPINIQKIFMKTSESTAFPDFKVWSLCEEKELQSFVTEYPTNAFEEMIRWTEEGKLWKFPIDNEQGMEKEHNVHFSEHVFLDRHLIGWCPNKGPIRHFMELVCIGLSKNPYMTIEEKYDHIMWYKEYFQDKTDLLQKLGLID